ncbi:MAG: hypothetical protein OXH00_23985 [Candidatus Poribacteria bacterium]|nr:hypothetical protein [Candidatus Poribacteria bacterium]
MQYIHYTGTDNSGYNCYEPSDSLYSLFENTVITPFRESLPEEANKFEDYNSNSDYINGLRISVLNRGSTDFDAPSSWRGKDYTPEHKVLLNGVFYMPMHLYSSYHFYRGHRHVIESENVVFIDFGCGPLTSGIAFWTVAGQCNITYIGVDISEHMLNKAAEINTAGPFGNSDEPFYKNFHLGRNFNNLPAYLNSIERGNPEDTLILFNFSYVLASMTFRGNINALINALLNIVQANLDYKIAMMYQNISGGDRNWRELKNRIINAFRHITFMGQNDTATMRVKYKRLMQGTLHPYDVSYDYFYNR